MTILGKTSIILLPLIPISHAVPGGYDALRISFSMIGFLVLLKALMEGHVEFSFNRQYILYMGVLYLSLIWSINRETTAKDLLSLTPMVFVYISFASLNRRLIISQLPRGIMALATVSGLVLIAVQLKYGTTRGSFIPIHMKSISNELAAYVELALPFVISGLYRRKKGHSLGSVWLVCMVAIIGVTIYTSQSRGYVSSCIFGVIAYGLVRRRPKNRMNRNPLGNAFRVGVACGGVALVLFLIAKEIPEDIRNAVMNRYSFIAIHDLYIDTEEDSIRSRFVAMADAKDVIEKYPWLGIGYGCFRDVSTYETLPHNAILNAQISCGVLGVALLLILLQRSIMDYVVVISRSRQISENEAETVRNLLVCLLMVLFHSLFRPATYNIMFHVLIAVGDRIKREFHPNPVRTLQARPVV